MHDEIVRHSLDGIVSDDNLIQTRNRLIEFLETQMREEGCVPLLDIDPQFTLDYDAETETYKFQLSVYGAKTEEDTWLISGIMSGKKIPKHSQNHKLNQS